MLKLLSTINFGNLVNIAMLSAAVASCGAPQQSSLKIDGGQTIDGSAENKIDGVFSTVTSTIGSSGGGGCTGTAVSSNTVISAAHCVYQRGSDQADPTTGEVRGRQFCVSNAIYSRVCSQKIYINPEYLKVNENYSLGRDTAYVVFPDDTFKNYFEIATDKVQLNDDVVLVGYSQYHLNPGSSSSKRFGYNKIADLEAPAQNDIITQSRGQFEDTGVSPGDSGGPMMRECKVVGVASRMAIDREGQTDGKRSIHTNLTHSKTVDFLLKSSKSTGAYFCGLSGQDKEFCDSSTRFNLVEDKWRKGKAFPCEINAADGGAKKDEIDEDKKDTTSSELFIKLSGDKTLKIEAALANGKSDGNFAICKSQTEQGAKSCSFSPMLKKTADDPFDWISYNDQSTSFYVKISSKDKASGKTVEKMFKINRK